VQAVLDAISSPRRREILRLVWDRELSAGDIAARFDVTWPAVSQNLRVLRAAGLVTERKEANRRFYRADRASLGSFRAVLEEMWSQDLDRLRRVVGGVRGEAAPRRPGLAPGPADQAASLPRRKRAADRRFADESGNEEG
jgi:DNA-binding transcriptional ArsR family regulator